MQSIYKTIFIPSPIAKPDKGYKYYNSEVDGNQLANDIQAAISEMETQGYRLENISPIVSTQYYAKTYTEGMLAIFTKKELA
jgi:hypothetical protein